MPNTPIELHPSIDKPNWKSFISWTRQVPDNIRNLWDTFTPEQKQALVQHFDDLYGKFLESLRD